MDTNASKPELQLPPFHRLLEKEFIFPFLLYFAFFRIASTIIKQKFWQDFKGFKKYRLQNLSICLLHSVISGLWSAAFLLFHPTLMVRGIIIWYNPIAAQLPILSMAYFLHDAIDMLNHEWSKWTLELLFHHVATCFSLSTGLVPRKFLLCTYWALLMEVNSIFLHCRTIMQISNYSITYSTFYYYILKLNVISFVLFRFLAQLVFIYLIIFHYIFEMHYFYLCVALGGPFTFFIINGLLFMRIIATDGYLGDKWRQKIATTRDFSKDDTISKTD